MKDPLWREIFIDSNNPDESESDSEEEDMTELYKKACAAKGIKVSKEVIEKNKEKRAVNSAKVELFNRQTNPNFVLPPIKHPSMHPKEKPFSNKIEELMFDRIMKKQKREEETHI
jgi:hypothetical protein